MRAAAAAVWLPAGLCARLLAGGHGSTAAAAALRAYAYARLAGALRVGNGWRCCRAAARAAFGGEPASLYGESKRRRACVWRCSQNADKQSC